MQYAHHKGTLVKYIHCSVDGPYLSNSKKAEDRRQRRQGIISARQQKKAQKLHRRLLKVA